MVEPHKDKRRVRIQAMLDPSVAEILQKQAEGIGISVSAMAAVLIKRGLDCESSDTHGHNIF